MATPGNRKKEARKTDSRCSALAGLVPAHTPQVAMTAATECKFEKPSSQSQYSPNMAPSDFYLFPKLKSHLRGTQYGSNVCVKDAINEYLGDQEKAFHFEGTEMGLVHCLEGRLY